MSCSAERRFLALRKRLDQLGYRESLGTESLALVDRLFSDLVHTTESLRNAKLSLAKTEKESRNVDAVLGPYRTDNARLVRENNELHLDLLKLREEKDRLARELKGCTRKLEHETTDLKFLNNQYVQKVRALERENAVKSERIQQLQERNMQAVVQTPGGKKRTIPFRRQRMQIDELLPPSSGPSAVVSQPDDPYIADLLQVADDRIHELQQDLTRLKLELDRAQEGIKHLNTQVAERDREIERLGRVLHGGRPHDVISLEAQNISNEKLIAHLNLQMEYLQEANGVLKQQLQERQQSASSQVAHLSARNQELCQELSHIDQLAEQLQKDKDLVLVTADQELQEAKQEIERQHRQIEHLEKVVGQLRTSRVENEHKTQELRSQLADVSEQKEDMEGLLNFLEEEKRRLQGKVEKMMDSEKELVLELERMRAHFGVCGKDRSPSRLDAFVRSLEDDRDFYKLEAERLCRAGHGTWARSPRRGKDGGSAELEQAVQEKKELQNVLLDVEKQMQEIQAKVRALTAERDMLRMQQQQAQEELLQLQRDMPSSQVAEKDRGVEDLQKAAMERDALRERLKAALSAREEDERRIHTLEETLQTLEAERTELRAQVSLLTKSSLALEEELRARASASERAAEEAAQQRAETSALRLLQEQMEQSLSDCQHQVSVKKNELLAAQQQIEKQEKKIAELSRHSFEHGDEMAVLQKTVSALDREKDALQEQVDQKTEKIAGLLEELSSKEKSLAHVRSTIADMENSLQLLQGALSGREREINSLRQQLDVAQEELAAMGQERELTLRENRRLQDDLATMTRENQAVHVELEQAMRDQDDLKMRVHSYIAEVARVENMMALKEQENRDLLEQFRSAHLQAEDRELKLQQVEGTNSSIRLELLTADTERRHLRERVSHLEREIEEHMNAQQAYEQQASSLTKSMAHLEAELRAAQAEKVDVLTDLAAVRELCVKLDSSKEVMGRQLTSKSMELERVMAELEDVRSEAELLKQQLSSERLALKNLETLLSAVRQKEFQSHVSVSEKEGELKALKERLALADTMTAGHVREVSQLRGKLSQLQTEMDVLKRQLTSERFERERALQEMRRQGLSFSSIRSSSPSPCPPSPEHSLDNKL
ncbi:centrosomal protein of 135 kDa isoform X2 [Scleropages formosus]|uniref:centrosomal protein of 135 kDa isoform X2 n=1 Tax=Scleropages formosus TaxID=113540 RepID=UPI000878DE8F|nr:centrosomal protein of 135 kDa isoform X2 [Scleropages formosus]